ncbi:uncharacterized protein LOC144703049 [Wolffia australiana]
MSRPREKRYTWRMERGQLKQRLWRVFKIPSFWLSCRSNTRQGEDVLEPLHILRNDIANRSRRDVTAVDYFPLTDSFGRRRGKNMDNATRMCSSPYPSSPNRYCFIQMKEELQKDDKGMSCRLKKAKVNKQKKLLSNGYGFSSSSSDNSLFSSEERDTAEVVITSGSVSSDSSLYYFASRSHCSKVRNKTKKREPSRQRRYRPTEGGYRTGFPRVLLDSSALSSSLNAKKFREENYETDEWSCIRTHGFAVEKQSKDPHADFKNSMKEMIMEKQIFQAQDLKDLLEQYLYLNDPCHHPIIVDVFTDVWEEFFGC